MNDQTPPILKLLYVILTAITVAGLIYIIR
jgi:hypothetical protein